MKCAFTKRGALSVGVASLLWGLSATAFAQTAAVYGSLGNFDVVNHTGHDAHGFEVQLEGVKEADLYGTYTYQRYGSPTVVPYATGIYVRYESQTSPTTSTYSQTTVAHAAGSGFAGTCYMGGLNYDSSGCEHFGIHLSVNPVKATYRWLVDDSANPGALVAFDPPAAVASPVYTVIPPIQVGAQPELEVQVEAPEPAEAPELYGDAQWIKVFKTQLTRPVALDELLTGNVIVPQDPTQEEISWDVIQTEPAAGGNGKRQRKQKQGSLAPDTRAVVRRIELYNFTGNYDPITHEALCADITCTAPSADEIGDFLSAQMTAANVQVNSLKVAASGAGGGLISSADRLISCGSKCGASYDAGAQVTLSVKPDSKSRFDGWTGACAGTATTCNAIVNGETAVGAVFSLIPTTTTGGGSGGSGGTGSTGKVVSVKISGGKGSIVSTPAGIDCGKTCSTTVAAGSPLALTATPEVGFRFVNWTGGCTGTNPTCSVVVNSALSAQANFTK